MSGTKIVNVWGERRLRAKADGKPMYAEIVGHGRSTYLWIGDEEHAGLLTISGEKTLRRFAEGILAALDGSR